MLQEMWEETKWMYQYTKKYKVAILLYIILGVVVTAMSLGGSVASKYLIDAITGVDKRNIGYIVFLIIAMAILGVIIKAVSSRITAKISVKVNNEIQREVYDKIMTTDWLSMTKFHSGDLLNRLKF